MNGLQNTLDLILLVVITFIWPLAEWRGYYPRSLRALAAGVAGARARIYRNIFVPEWGFTLCVIALWVGCRRSWAGLMLGRGTPLRLGIGLAAVGLVLCLLWLQRRALFAKPERLAQLRRRFGPLDPLIPRTAAERWAALALGITAGVCEELLYRGFVMWYLRSLFPSTWMGSILAAAVSSIFFGFAHIYLGARHALTTTLAGACFALVVLAAGSLWPAIILHAALDMNSFDLGYRALSTSTSPPADFKIPRAV